MNRLFRHQRTPLVVGVLGFLVVVAGSVLLFRRAVARRDGLDRPIDAAIEYTLDSLPNGVRYYVHARSGSGDRAELRLVVDAGSLQEDEDQRGLAHAVEHMVFRGTRRYPGGAVERWFDAIGMRRGDDVNATTSMDDTQYRMTVPTERAGAIDSALAMLASMAHEATFDAEDARREGGVLIEEWRSSRDVGTRLADARRPLLHGGTPYADRPVIGDTGVLRRFDVAAMRRYYETWYRPELMAVIVVGDFDADEVEAAVRRHFAGIPQRGPRRARPVRPVVDTMPAPVRALVVPDPEARTSRVAIWHRAPRRRYATRADYRASLVAWLWRGVLQGRLDDAALRAESPVADADVERTTLARAIQADVVGVTAMKGETLPALEVAAGEMRQLAEQGPTAIELEERGRAILNGALEGARDGDGNADRAEEFIDHFLTGNAIFTSRLSWELARDVLPTVTVEDVRAFARTRSPDAGAFVVVSATADDPVTAVAPEAVVARARAARGEPGTRLAAATDVRELLDEVKPTPGEIVQERQLTDPHAYEWTLSNGMRVLLKPTSFTFNEVQLRATAPGGASLATDDAYPSAYLADAVIDATGVGPIPAPRLRRWLESTSIELSPSVTDDAIGLDGRTAPADLEAFFQLLHLHLTAPRRDTVAFRRYQARAASFARDRGRDPDAAFRDSLTVALSNGDARAMKRGAPFYLRARLDDALDFWKGRAANGDNFTVAIAGDFTLAHARELVKRYLASIPKGAPEQPRDRGVPAVARGVQREVPAGIVARARTAIGFTGPFSLTNEELNRLGMVREVLARALNERLRDEMGGTYGVDVSLEVDPVPPARYSMSIEFESDPGRMEALAAATFDELARLHREGPTAAQFQGAREAQVRDFDGRLEDNEYWAEELSFHARHGWPLEGIAAHGRQAEATTVEDVRRACARYIPARDYVRVTMRPRSPLPGARHAAR